MLPINTLIKNIHIRVVFVCVFFTTQLATAHQLLVKLRLDRVQVFGTIFVAFNYLPQIVFTITEYIEHFKDQGLKISSKLKNDVYKYLNSIELNALKRARLLIKKKFQISFSNQGC